MYRLDEETSATPESPTVWKQPSLGKKDHTHLGNTVTNESDHLAKDMAIKRAKYVARNIELNQEFHFAAPATRLVINDIYNSSWFGSVTWNLFNATSVRIESSYNRSVKCMLDLPYATHRNLIEPLTQRVHLKKTLIKRFLMFMQSIEKSKKPVLMALKRAVMLDVRSQTGGNLRKIMILQNKTQINQISIQEVDSIKYSESDAEDDWKLEFLLQLLEERETSGLDSEGKEWIEHLCTE
jgi:hypothetical protein